MAYDVTSWFVDQANSKISSPVRKFTIGSSDYSDRVTAWPMLKVAWDQVRASKLTLTLANDDGVMNFLQQDKINMRQDCVIGVGFTHPTSGAETITLIAGKVEKFTMSKGTMRLTLADKFKAFNERVVGTSDNPVSYTGSNYLVSDIAWWLCTSYGGLDSTKSTANPDIDYANFSDWASVFSGDSVFLNARFTGMKVTEALRKISQITRSAIFPENDLLQFHRFSFINSYAKTLDNDTIIDLSVGVDDKDITNRQYMALDYDVTSRYHKSTVVAASSASVNSYGVREASFADASMWYVNSLSAINFCERVTTTQDEPYSKIKVRAPLVGMLRQIGEMVYVTDDQVGISNAVYRIMNRTFNMNTGEVSFGADPSQLLNAFRLDYSALDGSDVLS